MSRFIQCDGPLCDEVIHDPQNSNIEGWILLDLDIGRPLEAQEPGTVKIGNFEMPFPMGERISDHHEKQFHSWDCMIHWAGQEAAMWEANRTMVGD